MGENGPKDSGCPPTKSVWKPNATSEWYFAMIVGTEGTEFCGGARLAPVGRGGGSVCLERRKIERRERSSSSSRRVLARQGLFPRPSAHYGIEIVFEWKFELDGGCSYYQPTSLDSLLAIFGIHNAYGRFIMSRDFGPATPPTKFPPDLDSS